MDKSIKTTGQELFDQIKHTDEDGNEYWYARELSSTLGYASWENFNNVVGKAKLSVTQTGIAVDNHFHDIMKMVSVGYGNDRAIKDIKLTRYACYIIAQNGDAARKPEIASAQAYFAYKTRTQEVAEQSNKDYERLIARNKYSESDKLLSSAIIEKDMAPASIPVIKNAGDQKLFGGKTNKQMKAHYGITDPKKPLADRAPNVVLAAKSLANEITAHNLEQYPIDTFEDIKAENETNNTEIRQTLIKRGITPEMLPPAEDTEKVMKRFRTAEQTKQIED